MAKRQSVRARLLQFVLPFPMFQPAPDDGGPGTGRPQRRIVRKAVDVDRHAEKRQGSLWRDEQRKEAA
jgi:hypothetical protein